MSHLLVVEDEAVLRTELRRLFTRTGHDVTEAASLSDAERHDLRAFDLIIADLRLPDGLGTELIAKAPGVPVLVMTSYATIRSAVEAVQLGAVDYIAKPLDHDELVMLVDHILSVRRKGRERGVPEAAPARDGLIGSSAVMREVFERVDKVAPTSSTVLILGESGTG
jgi:DNA-binding NtrC family response regulator